MTLAEHSTPAGWFPEPTHGVGQRYWDGQKWTEYVHVSGQTYTSPVMVWNGLQWVAPSVEEEPTKIKIYWLNLLRFRVWWFSVATALLIGFLGSLVGIPSTPVIVITFLLTGMFWMTQQMACGQCGTSLRVTRLNSGQEVCHKCGAPTDKG